MFLNCSLDSTRCLGLGFVDFLGFFKVHELGSEAVASDCCHLHRCVVFLRHMEAHAGAFPSVSVVLKETGGGRSAVKDILSDVETRFAQSAGKQATLETLAAAQSSDSSETSGDDSEDSDEVEEFVPEGVSGEEIIDSLGRIPEADKKNVTFTNGQMIGSSHGEIETHSGLWSRLRKLGSQAQGSKPEVSSSVASNVDELRREVTTGSVALSFSDMSDLDVKKEGDKEDANGQEALNPKLEERHGLFVRYLSPHATPADLKEAFGDCGEIVRAQAIKPRTHQKFTYGFVDFKVCVIIAYYTCEKIFAGHYLYQGPTITKAS